MTAGRDRGGVVIVGSGIAALSTARALRTHGYAGPITMLARESVAIYDRPALSKSFLADDGAVPESLLAPGPTLGDLDIVMHTSTEVEVLDLGDRVVHAGACSWGYEWLVIATGARARRMGTGPAGDGHVHHLRELPDALRLRTTLRHATHLAIIGAGLIGLEVAAVARDRGLEVTVVEAADTPLGRVAPPAIGDRIAAAYETSGVRLRTGCRIARTLGPPGRVEGIELTTGEVVAADVVLACVGSDPHDELARGAGLVTDRGIVVDEYMRTSDARVFAVGDVARVRPRGAEDLDDGVRSESWRAAKSQGERAAVAILGRDDPAPDVPWMWSDLGSIHFQAAGAGPAEQVIVRGELTDRNGVCFVGVESGRVTWVGGAGRGGAVARLVRSGQGLMEVAADVQVDAFAAATDATGLTRTLVDAYRSARLNTA
jgi:3-phenylpropionate/trans-cinnamate dioxygenase ferredoxin reductase subunit